MNQLKSVVCGAVLWAGIGIANAGDVITVRADVWSPFNGEPASVDKQGYVVEILKAVFEPQGHKIDYKILPWTRTLKEVAEGKFDAAIGATKEDAEGCVFPDEPIGIAQDSFYVKKESSWKYDGIESVKAIKFAVIADYSYDENGEIDTYIKNAKEPKVQIMTGDDPLKRNIQKLQSGRVDAVLECETVVKALLQDMKIPEGDIVKAGAVGEPTPVYVAFSPKKEHTEKYAKMLSEGVIKMRADGSLKKILDKYGISDWKTTP